MRYTIGLKDRFNTITAYATTDNLDKAKKYVKTNQTYFNQKLVIIDTETNRVITENNKIAKARILGNKTLKIY